MATSQESLEETAVELANFISTQNDSKNAVAAQLYPDEAKEEQQDNEQQAPATPGGVQEEATTEAEVKEQPKEETKRDEFMELARRERKTREIAQKNKKLEEELQLLRGQVEGTKSSFSSEGLREEAKKNPYEFIQKYGLSVEEVANSAIDRKVPSGSYKASAEIEELRKEIQSIKSERAGEQEKQQKVSEQANYDKFIDQITNFVNDNGSDYELIKLQNGQTMVGDVIRRHFASSGDVLPYGKACAIVENHLEKRVEEALAANKYKTRLTNGVAKTVDKAIQDTPQVGSRPKTLTNKNSASPASTGVPVEDRISTVDDSIDELSKTINFWGE